MKWAQVLITGVMLIATPSIGVSVDCDNAYTEMERAICMDPRLLSVERRLSVLADKALESGHIDSAQSRWLRDSIAQDCRRSQQMNQCLLHVAEQRLQWLQRVTSSHSLVEVDF